MKARMIWIMLLVLGGLAVLLGSVAIVPNLSTVGLADPQSPAAAAQAGAPIMLNFQGRLLDSTGNPVSQTRSLTFRIKDGAGNTLWTETKNVQVSNGLFNTRLGDTQALSQDIFDGQALTLEMVVDSETLLPRQPLLPAPYAMTLVPNALVANRQTSGQVYAARFQANDSPQGRGILASGKEIGIWGASDTGKGVWGSSTSSKGVWGSSTSDVGVWGSSTSGTGVHATTNSGYAVHGASGSNHAIFGESGATYGLYTPNALYVGWFCTGCSIAYVAQNDDAQPLEVGDVVAVSGIASPLQGQNVPVLKVRKAAAAGEGVAGVVRGPSTIIKVNDKALAADGSAVERVYESAEIGEGDSIAPGQHLFIVVQGLTQIKADASLAPIRPGDALSTASSAGYSMKAAVDSAGQARPVLGKALESLAAGKRLIWALVSLE